MARERVIPLERLDDTSWRVPRHGGMRVDARVFGDEGLLQAAREDGSLQQVANVAHLPGIVGHALAMPDIHSGYGFPIGGVAATDPGQGGVVSPGGVGYDINCGVRLLRSEIEVGAAQAQVPDLVRELYRSVPAGLGREGGVGRVGAPDLTRILRDGAGWAVKQGLGEPEDLERCEQGGAFAAADPDAVGPRARERGQDQLGSLGSGNHFVELQEVEALLDDDLARGLGLFAGQLTLMIHSGSRGLGHQVCSDALQELGRAAPRLGIALPDPQLAAAPVDSPEGQRYLGAMFAAANYAWCNRQVLMHLAIEALERTLGASRQALGLRLLVDLAHNIATFERHRVDGVERRVLVHRKGATRAAMPLGEPLAPAHQATGLPVLIPGDMGRASYVCVGGARALEQSFGSSCHGAGRVRSRAQAKRAARGRDLFDELKQRGVEVAAHDRGTLAEEMPDAYKDVRRVVDVMARAGILRPVARLRPLGVIKG